MPQIRRPVELVVSNIWKEILKERTTAMMLEGPSVLVRSHPSEYEIGDANREDAQSSAGLSHRYSITSSIECWSAKQPIPE